MIFQVYFSVFWSTKMEWRENEHEEQDIVDLNHPETLQTLRSSDLYKVFTISDMKALVNLLEWMVIKWNVHKECFLIGDHRLTIYVGEIYWLSGLPHHGVDISLYEHRRGGETTTTYLMQHCFPRAELKDKWIDIKPLRGSIWGLSTSLFHDYVGVQHFTYSPRLRCRFPWSACRQQYLTSVKG